MPLDLRHGLPTRFRTPLSQSEPGDAAPENPVLYASKPSDEAFFNTAFAFANGRYFVTLFSAHLHRLSVRPDTVRHSFSHALIPPVQGHTRRKPVTQSFRSVSDR
jgi:hypothetical protein